MTNYGAIARQPTKTNNLVLLAVLFGGISAYYLFPALWKELSQPAK